MTNDQQPLASPCSSQFAIRNLKAILPVHAFGQPADMDPILAITRRHGLAVIEDAGERIRPNGYLDDNSDSRGQTLLGLPILGSIADLAHMAHDGLVVAIGDNRTRHRLFDQLQQQGERLAIAKHPAAVIAPDVSIGPDAMICAGVVVNPGSVIGANVILNTGCTVDHQSLWLDLEIIARTAWKTLKREDISQPGHATMEEFKGNRMRLG